MFGFVRVYVCPHAADVCEDVGEKLSNPCVSVCVCVMSVMCVVRVCPCTSEHVCMFVHCGEQFMAS